MTEPNQTKEIDPFHKEKWKGLSSQAVADYFLDLSRNEQPTAMPITNLKMQKLVYFAHFISLLSFKKPLISDEIEAWTYGPVIPALYNSLKKWEDKPIAGNIASDDNVEISSASRIIVEKTWEKLKHLTAGQLVDLSHKPGTPWQKVWNKGRGKFDNITNEDIIDSLNG